MIYLLSLYHIIITQSNWMIQYTVRFRYYMNLISVYVSYDMSAFCKPDFYPIFIIVRVLKCIFKNLGATTRHLRIFPKITFSVNIVKKKLSIGATFRHVRSSDTRILNKSDTDNKLCFFDKFQRKDKPLLSINRSLIKTQFVLTGQNIVHDLLPQWML